MVIGEKVQRGKQLKEVSTLGIGGPCLYYLEVFTFQEMREAFLFARSTSLRTFILGGGSNCLFDDRGFEGLVIHNKIDFCKINSNNIYVGGGYNFSKLGIKTALAGLSGLEFAAGIPASVGGAIYMNAGAFGQKVSDIVEKVCFLTTDGNQLTIGREDIEFDYRFSSFQKMQGAIVAAYFSLQPSKRSKNLYMSMINMRKKKQPLREKNGGCIFRNNKGVSAGYLIEKSGLKGKMRGKAKVSELHANFIINSGGATSKDVLDLISLIKKRVEEKMGISLKEEICYIHPNHEDKKGV